MIQNIIKRKTIMVLLFIVLSGMVWMSCSTTVRERQQGQTVTGETRAERESISKYYFDDVRVPTELNYREKKSFIYETSRFKAGVLVFSKWRLDVSSLIDFFTYNMEQDNWKLLNSFRGKESFLNFSKPDKTCTIKLVEKWYGTVFVEIRVGPLGEKKM